MPAAATKQVIASFQPSMEAGQVATELVEVGYDWAKKSQTYLLGHRFSGQMAMVALIGLFLETAIAIASAVLILRFQYFQ
jgi:hypothetical protein